LPKPPIPLSLSIGHLNDYIHIVGMFLFPSKLAAFGGMVKKSESQIKQIKGLRR
jgi:hypothetical protein